MAKLTFDADRHEYTYGGVKIPSVTEIIKPCTYLINNSKPWDNRYKERGTAVHEATMLYDYGEPLEIAPEYEGYIKAYERFTNDYFTHWVAIELAGVAEFDGFTYAGTVDRIGTIDGKPCVLDIKTGELHTASITAQLTAYRRIAWAQNTWGDVHLYGLKLSKDGTYKLKEYTADEKLLEACITIYTAAKGAKNERH